MKRRVPIDEVYERLIGIHPNCNGYKQCAQEIADAMHVSAVAIHKKIKLLKDKGCIAPTGKRSNCIYYSPTEREPPTEKLTTSSNHAGGGTYELSKSQWSCPITQMPPDSDLKGWEKKPMQNGVFQYLLTYPFVKPADGSLQFRILGKRRFTISVDFSRLILTENEVKNNKQCPPWVMVFVKMALLWVKRKYNIAMDVNDVHLSFPPHFETELREVDAKQFVNAAHIIIVLPDGNKIMVDRSKDKDKFETTFPPWLKEYIDLPSYRDRFNKMENELIPRFLDHEKKTEAIYEMLNKQQSLLEEQQAIDKKRIKDSLERGVFE